MKWSDLIGKTIVGVSLSEDGSNIVGIDLDFDDGDSVFITVNDEGIQVLDNDDKSLLDYD